MAHLTSRDGYAQLATRLNRAAQGAPPEKLLFDILAMLFSEPEAQLVAMLPLRPFTAADAARAWRVDTTRAERQLQQLAGRALLVDVVQGGRTEYVLPPPMAGFFEFALMRVRDDLDQKKLSVLYEEYISVGESFIKALFNGGDTQLGRVLVQEGALGDEQALHVLDADRASQVVETATAIGVGMCYCRHKKQHLGSTCSAEMEICLTFNAVADSLIRHGHARKIDREKAHDLLALAREQNLAHFGENVQQGMNFICNCCPCCCEAMLAARRFGFSRAVHTSNFIVAIDDNCSGCGRCLPVCPVRVLTLETDGAQGRGRKKAAIVGDGECLGCGVCVRNCPRGALSMLPREKRVLTPVNSVHKAVLMAIERGKLQHLIFDNQVLFSHRALAALLGAVLKLPPVKRALASDRLTLSGGAVCAL